MYKNTQSLKLSHPPVTFKLKNKNIVNAIDILSTRTEMSSC